MSAVNHLQQSTAYPLALPVESSQRPPYREEKIWWSVLSKKEEIIVSTLENSQMDSTLVHPSNYHSKSSDDLKKKVRELKAKLGEIYIWECHQNNSHDFNTNSPLFKVIMNEPIPHHFKMPSVDPYDGSIDPVNHLEGYKALTMLQGTFDDLLCLAFLVTLKKATRIWFLILLLRSIYSFPTI